MLLDVETVLSYWFGQLKSDDDYPELKSKLWFRKSDSTDAYIKKHFERDLDRIVALRLDEMLVDARTALAAIIYLDQFPRNCFRGEPDSFAFDKDAQQLTKLGIEKGLDKDLRFIERVFFYMPLMHAETKVAQKQSRKVFKSLVEDSSDKFKPRAEGFYDFAVKHAEIVERFGRFPHRNKVLGRESTAEEIEFLKQPGSSF